MGLLDSKIGGSVGGAGASGTLSGLGQALSTEQRKYLQQKLLELHQLDQAGGQIKGAMPQVSVETPFGSMGGPDPGAAGRSAGAWAPGAKGAAAAFTPRSTPQSVTQAWAQGRPPEPTKPPLRDPGFKPRESSAVNLGGVTPPPARTTEFTPEEKALEQSNDWQTNYGEPKPDTGKVRFTPEEIALEQGSDWQTNYGEPRPDVMEGMPPKPVDAPDTGAYRGSQGINPSRPKLDWGALSGVLGSVAHGLRDVGAPGNNRPYAQMGYWDERNRQDSEAQKFEEAQMAQAGATEREQMGNEASAERQRQADQAAWERQKAENEARIEAEKIRSQHATQQDYPITAEQAQAMGLPPSMAGMPYAQASQYAAGIARDATMSKYYTNTDAHYQEQEKQAARNEQRAYLQVLMERRKDPMIMLDPKATADLDAQISQLQSLLYPDMVRPAPQGPPLATEAPPTEGGGVLGWFGNKVGDVWDYWSKGGLQPETPAAQPQGAPPMMGPSPGQPGGGPHPLAMDPQAQQFVQLARSLQVGEDTQQAVAGILIKNQNPMDIDRAISDLIQNADPQEKQELLKLQAQLRQR